MIHNNNTIIITTTLPNNSISFKRINNLINNFSNCNIPIVLNHGIIRENEKVEIGIQMIKKSIEIYKKTNYEYTIICEDDFFPIDNFLDELNKTVELLYIRIII